MEYARSEVGAFLEALGARTPSPASGAAIALTGAVAAATAELAARFADDGDAVDRAVALRDRFLALAEEDAAAYEAFMEKRSDANRSRTIDVPLAIAECGYELVRLARSVEPRLGAAVATDAAAAAILARAVAAAAARLVAANASSVDDRVGRAEALAADAARL